MAAQPFGGIRFRSTSTMRIDANESPAFTLFEVGFCPPRETNGPVERRFPLFLFKRHGPGTFIGPLQSRLNNYIWKISYGPWSGPMSNKLVSIRLEKNEGEFREANKRRLSRP